MTTLTSDKTYAAHARRALALLAQGWSWFTAWRRTRPFWGGLWSVLAGAEIIRSMDFDFVLAVSGGWSYSAGYILGGGIALFGLVAWFAPLYRALCGVAIFLLALGAFVGANLGGYLIGTILGIIGGSMVWAWGEKRARPARKAARKRRGR
ncbi:MAG: hypothetical protein J2O46_08615 [Nocardioides sp.]|nr:hypothetical protein [Nocardioides sp.]